ncbi:ras-related protein Rab-22A-like [Haliotis rubra]|uniref:ras-related protein Rab-22A-like n=1 Tax=Haliotis rubra TaxID=36100 RepID=UPI001EE5A182|nr:ras-related protein Rab-22A-like [Haliotis rubra]
MSLRDVKLCLLGDSGVGKSSIVMRFVNNQFKNALESTIGASFMTKTLLVDGNTYKYQIWDTAGQEKYRALAPMYYRGAAAAAIIVYDVTRESTFRSVKSWVQELRRQGSPNIVIAIAGNKCDLEDLREVRKKDAQDYAKDINAIFCETSALTAVNVPQLFDAISKELPPEEFSNQRYGSTVNLRRKDEPRKKGKCCGGGGRSGEPDRASSRSSKGT